MTRTTAPLLLAFALVACDGGSTGTSAGTDGPGGPGGSDGPLSLTVPVVGDFTCFNPTDDHAATTWLSQTPAAGNVQNITINGQAQEFRTDDPSDLTVVSIWNNNTTSGPADASAETDGDGRLTISAPSCQPVSYLALRDQTLEADKPTYKAHQVYPPVSPFDGEFITVSNDTFLLIPSILGVTPEPGKSIIAGTAYDCTRDPVLLSDIDDGKVRGAQVLVKDASGNLAPGVSVFYFVERFPDRDQPHTSADGLWIAINVPEGEFRVELWGLIDDEERLLGATRLTSVADSINISNIFGGFGDGVKLPNDCLDPDAGGDDTDADDTDADTDIPG